MEFFKNRTEKLCSFYVSDWHLVTMVLPYINKELNEKANIITILEDDIENNIKTLVSKLNLKTEKEILAIDWKKCENAKLPNKFQLLTKKKNIKNIVFVKGSKAYIDLINRMMNQFISENINHFKHSMVKMINCYEITEFNHNIKEILDTHTKVLNTSGEKYISEVFEGYPEVEEMC